MQGDPQIFPRKPVAPLSDQVGNGPNGYVHNAPIASIFDRTVLPPGAKQLRFGHGVEFQPSEVCPRNFIIFDQTNNRSQIMFHPAMHSKFCYPALNTGASYFQDTIERKGENNGRDMSSWKEDSDDINVLLSSEEEDEEEFDEEEVSTARTHGNSGSDSPDSCCNYGSKPRKSRLPSLKKSSGSGTSCSEIKRQKMRKMVKALRGIVPGANQMNTVAVLDESVRYLKSLKVEMQKLGVGNIKI